MVEFPAGASSFTGEIVEELIALVDAGTIRVIDVLILTKNEDGTVEAMELSEIEAPARTARAIEAQLAELLAEEDVEHLAAALDPGGTAGVLIWENLWAAPFISCTALGWPADRHRTDSDQAIIASIEADEAHAIEGD